MKKVKGTNESYSLISDFDIHLFREGKHFKLYEKLGSHVIEHQGVKGTVFAVWAPDAEAVSLIGNFNHWNRNEHIMHARWDSSGIWEIFLPHIGHGEVYKYSIKTKTGEILEKSDPFAFYWEQPPNTASVVWDIDYTWKDKNWLKKRAKTVGHQEPMAVYEVHLGSWKRNNNGGSLSYRELAVDLVAYVKEMGFTHVEFMPVMEHPFYGSWGYQVLGYFAPTSRYGSPQDFMYLIQEFHKADIGVILDWVPSHFPGDEHGLYKYDGSHLYEHADPWKGYHPDWTSYIFNYDRNEVRSFLISSALFWLDKYHADGLRVDAVASMLYLDYSRKDGEWIPNIYGGNENLEAIHFLKQFNEAVYAEFPDVVTIAEESTNWSNVSRPTYTGGLGFGQKWMMGWMHDSLEYFKKEPVYRKYHQDEITFSLVYAFTENFMLPLSHDEVVHGKKSIMGRMPGDEWQRFANLRLLYGLMYAHPGTKLLFMGAELGQYEEWDHEGTLGWHLLNYNFHKNLKKWVQRLNAFYKENKGLHKHQFEQKGFQWIDHADFESSVIVFMRKGDIPEDTLVVACNFTPTARHYYRFGVPEEGPWQEVLNSDELEFGGSNIYNPGAISTEPVPWHLQDFSIVVTLPPLSMTVFQTK